MRKGFSLIIALLSSVISFAQYAVKETGEIAPYLQLLQVDSYESCVALYFECTAPSDRFPLTIYDEAYVKTEGSNKKFNLLNAVNIPTTEEGEYRSVYLDEKGQKHRFVILVEKFDVSKKFELVENGNRKGVFSIPDIVVDMNSKLQYINFDELEEEYPLKEYGMYIYNGTNVYYYKHNGFMLTTYLQKKKEYGKYFNVYIDMVNDTGKSILFDPSRILATKNQSFDGPAGTTDFSSDLNESNRKYQEYVENFDIKKIKPLSMNFKEGFFITKEFPKLGGTKEDLKRFAEVFGKYKGNAVLVDMMYKHQLSLSDARKFVADMGGEKNSSMGDDNDAKNIKKLNVLPCEQYLAKVKKRQNAGAFFTALMGTIEANAVGYSASATSAAGTSGTVVGTSAYAHVGNIYGHGAAVSASASAYSANSVTVSYDGAAAYFAKKQNEAEIARQRQEDYTKRQQLNEEYVKLNTVKDGMEYSGMFNIEYSRSAKTVTYEIQINKTIYNFTFEIW